MTSAQLHIDPEAEVREGLWGGFVEVFRPDTLLRHCQDGVSDRLHLHQGERPRRTEREFFNILIFFIDLKKRSLYLKSSEGGFEISEHGRALVQSRGVFVEARLPHDRHARVELEGVVDSELRINDLLLGQ